MRRRIVLGVTSSESLVLMRGLPDRLQNDGWEVHVVANGDERLEALRAPNVVPHALTMTRDPSPARDLHALWQWIRLLRSLRPDVVLIGTPKAGLVGLIAAAVVRVPVRLYHLRGLRLETVSGWKRKVFAGLERLSMGLATETIAVSHSLKARVETLGLVAASRVVVLGEGSSNGVDTDHFHPAEADLELRTSLGLDATRPVIGFVGRVTKDKGGVELAGASAALSRRGISHQLLVVGPVEGDDAMRSLAALSPTISVIHTGQVRDTAPYFRLMTVFCLPTLREGFPNVVLEAAASGVPVVTTDATGAIDSVIDGETGYLSRVGDSSSLADQLQRAIEDEDGREQMTIAGLERVREHFRRDVVQDLLVAHITSRFVQHDGVRGTTPRRIG